MTRTIVEGRDTGGTAAVLEHGLWQSIPTVIQQCVANERLSDRRYHGLGWQCVDRANIVSLARTRVLDLVRTNQMRQE